MEISIKWNICRVCLQEEKKTSRNGDSGSSIKFVHLFDENKKLANQILELSGVAVSRFTILLCSLYQNKLLIIPKMKPGDFLPEKICSKCVTIVDNAIKLCRTCRSSNTYLQSILERTRSASNLLKSEMSVSKSHNDDDCMEDSKIEDNADVPNENVTICNKKRRHESLTNQTINSLSDQEQLAVNVNISDYIVEEIIVMSDEDEVATGNNSDAKTEDITENRKPSPADCSHTYEDLKEDQVSVSEKFVEFVNVDHEENNDCNIFETVMVGAEEQIIGNEDQAQVSSTVDTKEEFDYYEDNSNISNFSDDLDKKSAINEDTSNCSISSTKHAETPKKSHSHNDKVLLKLTPIEERKSPIVFSKRKMKRNRFKSAAYEPVQVCVCEICGNRFTNQNKMKLHMKIHLQHKNHQCE